MTKLWDELTSGTFVGAMPAPPKAKPSGPPKKINSDPNPPAEPVEICTGIILLRERYTCNACKTSRTVVTNLLVRKRRVEQPNRTDHYEPTTLDEALLARKITIRHTGRFPRWKTKTLPHTVPLCEECFQSVALEEVEEE